MAEIASADFGSTPYAKAHKLKIDVTVNSTNPSANTSNVTGTLYIVPKSDSVSWSNYINDNSYSFTFNGVTYPGNFTFDFRYNRVNKELVSKTIDITHDANGAKTITASGSANTIVSINDAAIGSTSFTLSDFDRRPSAPSGAPTLSRTSTGEAITVVSRIAPVPTSSPSAPATSYQYQQSTTTNFTGAVAQSLAIPTSGTTVGGLTATQQYYYQTRAVNVDGAGPWSATATYIGAPAIPTSFITGFLNAVATPTTATAIALDWGGDTTNVEHYRVEYKRSTDSVWTTTAHSGTTSAYQVTGLSPNVSYNFRVYAENTTASLVSGYATLSAATLPTAPSGLTVVSVTSSSAVLDWDDNTTGITNFVVQYKKASDAEWLSTSYTGTVSNTTITGLAFNTEYNFRVAAQNTTNGTISAYSEVNGTTLPSGPSIRSDVSTWSPSAVYVCTTAGSWTSTPNGSMYVCTSTSPQTWTAVG